MTYSLAQQYAIAHSAQQVESAAEALTLTNNQTTGLVANLTAAVAALLAIVSPTIATNATVSNGQSVSVVDGDGSPTGVTGSAAVANSVLGAVTISGTNAIVANAASVAVKDFGGTSVSAACVATVAGGVVTGVALPTNIGVLFNGASAVVSNSAGTQISAAAVPVITAGKVTRITLPSTQAGITSGTKVTATVTGSGTTGVTPTIVNGVVTGFVLS